MVPSLQNEIDQNFDFFQRKLGALLSEKSGEFALIRHQEIVSFAGSAAEAEQAGAFAFEDGMFSVQEVGESSADLGFYTHAFDQG